MFGEVFDFFGAFQYQYGAFVAPNFGAPGIPVAFSAVATGEGGADQGAQQLLIVNDYENADHLNNPSYKIESSVFRNYTITADDIGKLATFSFDAKFNDLAGSTTARATIKTLDAMFNLTNLVEEDMTVTPATWTRYTISLELTDPALEGQLFQFGFSSRASAFESSGILYDNIVVGTREEAR